MSWRLLITGCGTSHGNPPWGYPQLWSEDRRDQRRRSGALLQGPAGEVILFDGGPDLAAQLRDPFAAWDGCSYPSDCIVRCDGVLFTHDHADHMHGFNELRHLNRLMRGGSIPIYGNQQHLQALCDTFGYMFTDDHGAYSFATPSLRLEPIEDGVFFNVGGLQAVAVPLSHGIAGRVSGFRLGELAYLTDCKTIPEESYRYLHGLDLLVLDMLREEEHPTHMNFDEALAALARIRPRRCVFVHMGWEVRYRDWQPRLPAGVELAYDGWQSVVDCTARWSPA